MRFLTGGYTADMDGAATGIGMLVAGSADAPLAGGPLGFAGNVVDSDGSPSWVAAHPALDVVYAALEGAGSVQAFARTGEASFVPLGAPVPAGELVCHVAVSSDGTFLVASAWGDGRVVRMGLDAAGRPSAPVIAATAADPYAEPDPFGDAAPGLFAGRGADGSGLFAGAVDLSAGDAGPVDADAEDAEDARVSRAHQAVFLPGGLVATTDLGYDLVRFWRPAERALRAVGAVVLPRGSGPRHLHWHPSGHLYVITELSCEVFVLARDAAGVWRLVSGTSLGRDLLDDDAAAELAAARDGESLTASVRGSNTIATLRVRGDGSQLEPVALVESGVDWPRHHIVVRDTLLAAGQRSNDVVSLPLDERNGIPGRARHRTPVPSPTCVSPLR